MAINSILLVAYKFIYVTIFYLQMCYRISLLGVNKVWEKKWITNKKYGGIVSHEVPVSLFGVKFYGKSTRISGCVGRTRLSTNGTESHSYGCLLTECVKNGSL